MGEHDEDHEATAVRKKPIVYADYLGDIDYKNVGPDSEKWAKEFLSQNYLILSRKSFDPTTCELPPTVLIKDRVDEHEDADSRGHTINMKPDMTLREMADLIFSAGTLEQKHQLRHLGSGLPLNENCLVENWVSSGRYAFIDLSAGPFSWGPLAGGTGLKTSRLFPDFEERYSATKGRYRLLTTADIPGGDEEHQTTGRKPLQLDDDADYTQEPPAQEDDLSFDGDEEGFLEEQWEFEKEDYEEEEEQQQQQQQVTEEEESLLQEDAPSRLSSGERRSLNEVLKYNIEESVFLAHLEQYCSSDRIEQYKDFCTRLVSKFQDIEYSRKKKLVGPKLPFRFASFSFFFSFSFSFSSISSFDHPPSWLSL